MAVFDWTGTSDTSPILNLPAAPNFHTRIGGDTEQAYNHGLVVKAVVCSARRFGGTSGAQGSLFRSIDLASLPERLVANEAEAQALLEHLMYRHHIKVSIIGRSGRLCARLVAQVYCQTSDFEILAGGCAPWSAIGVVKR